MYPFYIATIHSVIFQGAVTGFLTAALVDYHAFRTWQSFHDAAIYDWRTAAFRWVQGTVAGAITAGGFSAIS